MSEPDTERPQLERFPTTGDPQVDEALARLDGVEGRPVEEHVAAYEQVHGALRDALSRPVEGIPDPGPRAPR